MTAAPRPTGTELAILRALWELGPSTVKQVHQHLGRERDGEPVGYTTALKMMQTMHDKGLLRRDESERSHVYSTAQAKASVQKGLVGDFMERVFAGSALDLVQAAISSRKLSPKEKAELRTLLKEKP